MYDLTKIQEKVESYLDKKRFNHTLGVRYTAAALAMCHGEDILKAEVAGLLHDCAKCIHDDELLALCRQHEIVISDTECAMPFLLHAKVGAWFAYEKYQIEDTDILNAITYHTTGRPQMSLLEKIVYLADYIEPEREQIPRLAEIRKECFRDIDKALEIALANTIYYCEASENRIDETTRLAYEFYKNK